MRHPTQSTPYRGKVVPKDLYIVYIEFKIIFYVVQQEKEKCSGQSAGVAQLLEDTTSIRMITCSSPFLVAAFFPFLLLL